MSRKMMIIMMIEITTSSHICLKEKKVKLLVFIVHSWFRRSRGKYNNKSDDKYNNTNINATQDQLEVKNENRKKIIKTIINKQ